MGNLQRQVVSQRQPYFEIFYAFNYMDKNLPQFKTFLSEALRKCSDPELIEHLEMWILSYNLTFNGMDPKIVARINEGIRLINRMEWQDAENVFNILTRQANNVAPPWFYEGVIKFENGGQYSAESMFERALEINPGYIAPRLFNFEILYEQNSIDKLLTEVEEAIEAYDIWLFHFWKARALFAKAKYKDAIAVIENNCNAMNPWTVDAYFLLGDSYRELNHLDKAEEAYRKTVDVDPYMDTSMFDVKMTMLLEMKQ
jgi:tetratricopeptide (TPR) repeat protein